MKVAGNLAERLVEEKRRREEAEKRAATHEAEKAEVDAKWRAELEAKQSTIVNLQTHHSKQAAVIDKLKEEVAQLKRTVEGSEREVEEWKAQVGGLERELEAARLEGQNLRVALGESKVAHQSASDDARSIEARLKFVTSEEGKKVVIEEYRQGPMGKVELSLAVKAGYDYLKAQLPSDVLPSLSLAYPPRVESSLRILQSLEARGAGVQLSAEDNPDEDEDDEEDEGEGGEEGDGDEGGD